MTSLCLRVDRHGLLGVGAAMLAARSISVLTGIGLALLLARGLGAQGYGLYVFALTIALMLSMLVQMGLPALLVRQVAIYRSRQDWAHLSGIARWSVAFVVLSLTIVGILAGGYLFIGEGFEAATAETIYLYILTLVLVAVQCFIQLAGAALHGFERVFWGSLADGVIRPALLLALVFAFSRSVDLTPHLAMGLHVVAALVALAWSGIMVARHCRIAPSGTSVPPARFEPRAWVASLLPLALHQGAAMINGKLDVVMLGILSTKEAVGNYGLAFQMAGLIVVVQTIVNAMISPRIARLHAAGDGPELQELVTHACRLSALGALACGAAIFTLGEPIVRILIGVDFADAPKIAIILSLGLILATMLGPTTQILNMTGHERITARTIMCAALLNAVLNALLIPRFGPYGAAAASAATVVFSQSVLAYHVRRKVGVDSTILGLPRRLPRPDASYNNAI